MLRPEGGADVITARDVVKVMVDVRLLRRADADEAAAGAPVGALNPPEGPRVAVKLTVLFPFWIEEGLRKIFDTALDKVVEVVLIEFDEGTTDTVMLLFVVKDNEEFRIEGPGVIELHAVEEINVIMLLELVIGTAADAVGVTLLLEDILSPRLEVLTGSPAIVEALAKLEDDVSWIELIEKLNPGMIAAAVVELLEPTEVRVITVTDKVDMTSGQDEKNGGRASEAELGSASGTVKLAVGEIGVTFEGLGDITRDDAGELAKLSDTTALGSNAMELRGVEITGQDDGYEILEADNMVVGNDTVVTSTVLEDRGDGAEIEDGAAGQGAFVLDDCKGAEKERELSGNGISVGRADEEPSMIDPIGEMVTVIVVICPELVLVTIVVSALAIVLETGSMSDVVKLALENIMAELVGIEGSSFVTVDSNEEFGDEVAPPLLVVIISVEVVACPPETVVASVVGDAVMTPSEVAAGGAALGTFVGNNVSIVVRPSDIALVTATGKSGDASDPTLDEVSKEMEVEGSSKLGVEIV